MSESNTTCPNPDQLLGYNRKTLPQPEVEKLTAHLKGCRTCQKALVSLVVSSIQPAKLSSDETLDPDTMIAPGGATSKAQDLDEE